MKTRILLTSAGGLTGVFLTKHLTKFEDLEIFCIDMSSNHPLLQWTKNVYLCPASNSLDYTAFIRDFLEKHSIHIVIPVTSYDMEFFSKKINSKVFGNSKSLIVDEEINTLLSSKEKCYSFLNWLGIKTPLIYTCDNVTFPCFIKPIVGSGSKNSLLIENDIELSFWKTKIPNFLIMEYIAGKEYTVDCLFDTNGNCIGYNTRERIKTNGGGATISQNIDVEGVQDIIVKFESIGSIRGPINFQFKVVDNEIVVFDFNTRLASGGLPLTVKSGFDIPRLIIDLLLGKQVENYSKKDKKPGLKMVRFYEEFFCYE